MNKITRRPLIKQPLHAIKHLQNTISGFIARSKQPIIRQGAPECFLDSSPLKIEWALTSYCNYRCSYCFQAGKGYGKDFCSLEQAEEAIKHIASSNHPSYQVSLQGGEPTSHPYFAEIVRLLCKHLGERLESLVIITNGSFDEGHLQTIVELMKKYSIKIYVSVHLEFMSVDRAAYLVQRLAKHGLLSMTVMLQPDYFEKAKEMAVALFKLRQEYPFQLEVKYLRTPPSFDSLDPRYTQEHFDWVEAANQRIIEIDASGAKHDRDFPKVSGWEYIVERKVAGSVETFECGSSEELRKTTGWDFSGMTCCAGANVLSINAHGIAKGLLCSVPKLTCNIFEENPFEIDDWVHGVMCTIPMCGCVSNHRVPKFNSSTEAEKFMARVKEAQYRFQHK